MLIADLPGTCASRRAFSVELRIGARPLHQSHVDDEIDVRFLEQIGEFDDRSREMTYGGEDVCVAPTERRAPNSAFRACHAPECLVKNVINLR
jgi:hypothetical protein